MKITAKLNETDHEMVELYNHIAGIKCLMGAVHKDHFTNDENIYKRLNDTEEIELFLSLTDE